MNDDMRELERSSRKAFDESVEALDAETRSRLARARAHAIDGLRQRRAHGPVVWIPVGAAAAALVAALLWQREEGVTASADSEAVVVAFEDLDLIVSGEDLDMLHEDEGFYAWAGEQVSDGVG